MNNDTREQSVNRTGSEQPTRSFSATIAFRYGNEYLRLSATMTYSYLFVLPLVVIYEIGTWLMNAGSALPIRIGADVMIKRLLEWIGLGGTFWFGILLLVVGGAIFFYERKKGIAIRPRYFGWMFGESALYGVVLGLLVGTLVGGLFGMAPVALMAGPELDIGRNLILSLGAGIYEELIFRLFLVSALVLLLSALKMNEKARYITAAVIAALIFSAVHYIGDLGDTFTLSSFTFRFLMGLALNGVFIMRGFGIAAMTHALYDVWVTVLM